MQASYSTEPVGAESATACTCCGRPIFEGSGWLLQGEEELACYAYRWAEGHEMRFMLAIAGTTAGVMRSGYVVISCARIDESLHYSVVEPDESPWGSSEEYGRPLSREEALASNGLYPDLWQLNDEIVRHEPRLAQRILALCGA
jgi:hypothetical protein